MQTQRAFHAEMIASSLASDVLSLGQMNHVYRVQVHALQQRLLEQDIATHSLIDRIHSLESNIEEIRQDKINIHDDLDRLKEEHGLVRVENSEFGRILQQIRDLLKSPVGRIPC